MILSKKMVQAMPASSASQIKKREQAEADLQKVQRLASGYETRVQQVKRADQKKEDQSLLPDVVVILSPGSKGVEPGRLKTTEADFSNGKVSFTETTRSQKDLTSTTEELLKISSDKGETRYQKTTQTTSLLNGKMVSYEHQDLTVTKQNGETIYDLKESNSLWAHRFQSIKAGAMAVGGFIGPVLSWIPNKISEYRRDKKFAAAVKAQEEVLFKQEIQKQAQENFEKNWAAKGATLVEKMVENQTAIRVKSESAPLIEERVEALLADKVQTESQIQFESKWAKQGTDSVSKRVDSLFAKRVETEAAPKVEALISERLPGIVEKRAEEQIAGPKAQEIEDKVQKAIEQRVDKAIADRADGEVEKRLDKEIDSRFNRALRSQRRELNQKVEEMLAAHVQALAEQRGATSRPKFIKELSKLKTDLNGFKSRVSRAIRKGQYPNKDRSDEVLGLAKRVMASQVKLQILHPETRELQGFLRQNALTIAKQAGKAGIMNANEVKYGAYWKTIFDPTIKNLESAFNTVVGGE